MQEHASVRRTTDLTWENGKVYPQFEPEGKENWDYFVPKNDLYLSIAYFEQLKQNNVPSALENYYQGSTETNVPYGSIETINLSINENTENTTYTSELYYDHKTGILVKGDISSETNSRKDGYYLYRSDIELNETNLKLEKTAQTQIPWMIVIGIVIIIVIAAVLAWRKYG